MLLGESIKKMRVGSVCRGTENRREGGRLIARGDGGQAPFFLGIGDRHLFQKGAWPLSGKRASPFAGQSLGEVFGFFGPAEWAPGTAFRPKRRTVFCQRV